MLVALADDQQPEYASGTTMATRLASGPTASSSEGVFGSHKNVESWLAANIGRAPAERALLAGGFEVGSYCVRAGSDGSPVLTVLNKHGIPMHFRIVSEPGGRFAIDVSGPGRQVTYPTIHELVTYFGGVAVSSNVGPLTSCIPLPQVEALPTGGGLYAAGQ